MARPLREVPWIDLIGNVYYALWYDQGARRTKRQSLGTRDSMEAQARFAAFLVEGREILSTTSSTITVDKALDDYVREHVGPKVKDRTRQENAVTRLKQHFSGLPLPQVDVLACRAYAEVRRSGSLPAGRRRGKDSRATDSTIRRELNVLVAATNHAVLWKRLLASQLPTFELPAENVRTVDDDLPSFLKKSEIQLLFDTTTGALNTFCRLGYWTGARRASIETLRVEQVDWDLGVIKLLKPGEMKTKKRKPIVPIYPEIRDLVEVLCAEAKGGWLFGSSTIDFYRPFNNHCRMLDFGDGREHPHVLRHSRITHRLMDGDSIYQVARSVGDTVATIERVYGHASPEFLMETKR